MEESAAVICLKCMAPNPDTAHVCGECGSVLAQTNFLDPIATIYEQGSAHSKAIYTPTKPIVVITIWLISLPVLIASLFGVAAAIDMPGFQGLVFFWIFVGIAAIAAASIFRVTKNYIGRRERSTIDRIS